MHHEISICTGILLGGSTMSDVECNRVRYGNHGWFYCYRILA